MTRARMEFALAGLFAVLALLTALVPTWIEEVFKVDPDAGSGALEWLIVAVFGVSALTAALLGRHHYRASTSSDYHLHR
jgi:hypothetical protein